MYAWHSILKTVLLYGSRRADRTGVGTLSCFGLSAEFENTEKSFPAVTTKKLAFKQMAAELACFIQGSDNLEDFHKMGCTIWDGNGNSDYWKPRARFEGDLGRIYGAQWRNFGGADQLTDLVKGLKKDPYSRRHLVTAWNPGELDKMCLPPCHCFFQCYVDGKYLDLQVYMRSVDLVLGLPFDIASYALLQHLIAAETGYVSRRLLFSFGDAHIYRNHIKAAETILTRQPKLPPELVLSGKLFTFRPEEASLKHYDPWPAVKAELNV